MRLYLDDDSIAPVLVTLLKKAGHDVCLPAQMASSVAADPIHLRWAVREGRTLLSGNHDDFELLHLLIREAAGGHSGIVIVRKDNDRSRDFSPRGIVTALGKLGATQPDLRNEFVILNHWR